jgi:hypothetical protein
LRVGNVDVDLLYVGGKTNFTVSKLVLEISDERICRVAVLLSMELIQCLSKYCSFVDLLDITFLSPSKKSRTMAFNFNFVLRETGVFIYYIVNNWKVFIRICAVVYVFCYFSYFRIWMVDCREDPFSHGDQFDFE